MRSIASVRVSVCPVHAVTFESLELESFTFGTQRRLQNIWIKFVRQGDKVKVKLAYIRA